MRRSAVMTYHNVLSDWLRTLIYVTWTAHPILRYAILRYTMLCYVRPSVWPSETPIGIGITSKPRSRNDPDSTYSSLTRERVTYTVVKNTFQSNRDFGNFLFCYRNIRQQKKMKSYPILPPPSLPPLLHSRPPSPWHQSCSLGGRRRERGHPRRHHSFVRTHNSFTRQRTPITRSTVCGIFFHPLRGILTFKRSLSIVISEYSDELGNHDYQKRKSRRYKDAYALQEHFLRLASCAEWTEQVHCTTSYRHVVDREEKVFHLWIGMFRAENKIEMKLLEGGNEKLLKIEKKKKGDDNCAV